MQGFGMKNGAVLEIINQRGKGQLFVRVYLTEAYVGCKGIHIVSPVCM
jgi:hypothetical protein